MIINIVAIAIILLGGLMGLKKGAIKEAVNLICIITICILAYQFKSSLTGVFIKYLPFYNYAGYEELYALNFMVYDAISFAVIYVLLYCFLNILLNLSGILELLTKFNVIFKIPDKIAGFIIGAIESLIFVFILAFVAGGVPHTQKYVYESTVTKTILEKTPIVTNLFANTIMASEGVYEVLTEEKDGEVVEVNLTIIRKIMQYEIIPTETINECIKNGKLHLNNVTVAS